jgi:hypothetical protein
MRWVGHVAWNTRNEYNILIAKPEDKRHQGVNGMIILEQILGTWVWSGFIWIRIGQVAVSPERGKTPQVQKKAAIS